MARPPGVRAFGAHGRVAARRAGQRSSALGSLLQRFTRWRLSTIAQISPRETSCECAPTQVSSGLRLAGGGVVAAVVRPDLGLEQAGLELFAQPVALALDVPGGTVQRPAGGPA